MVTLNNISRLEISIILHICKCFSYSFILTWNYCKFITYQKHGHPKSIYALTLHTFNSSFRYFSAILTFLHIAFKYLHLNYKYGHPKQLELAKLCSRTLFYDYIEESSLPKLFTRLQGIQIVANECVHVASTHSSLHFPNTYTKNCDKCFLDSDASFNSNLNINYGSYGTHCEWAALHWVYTRW